MPVYEYEAISRTGRSVSGLLDADSPADARARLRDRGLFASALRQALRGRGRGLGASLLALAARPNPQKVGLLLQQLAVLLSVGVPLRGALTTLIDQVRSRRLEGVLRDVREKVVAGGSLADSLKEHPRFFDDLVVSMVAAGESSGELAAVLESYSDHVLRREELRAHVKAALTYPLIVLVVGALAVGFLVTYVVPRVSQMLAEVGQQLPLPTRVLVALGDSARHYGLFGLVGLLGLVLGYRALLRRHGFRRRRDALLLALPIWGPLATSAAMSRFTSTLALLLRSGLPLHEALLTVRQVVDNSVLAEAVDDVRARIMAGSGMAEPMRRHSAFPAAVAEAISVGEESGGLDRLLEKLSEAYDKEVALGLRQLAATVEPVLILVMGAIVLFIVVSVLQPIMRVSSLQAL